MRKKLLLADDSITIQKVVELTFPSDEFEVVTAGNGRVAVEKAASFLPDMVLCDVIMPQLDGYQVCEALRAMPELNDVPILLLNGAFEPYDPDRARAVGALGNVSKPFDPPALVARVKDILAERNRALELPSPAETEEAAPVLEAEEPMELEPEIAAATMPAATMPHEYDYDESETAPVSTVEVPMGIRELAARSLSLDAPVFAAPEPEVLTPEVLTEEADLSETLHGPLDVPEPLVEEAAFESAPMEITPTPFEEPQSSPQEAPEAIEELEPMPATSEFEATEPSSPVDAGMDLEMPEPAGPEAETEPMDLPADPSFAAEELPKTLPPMASPFSAVPEPAMSSEASAEPEEAESPVAGPGADATGAPEEAAFEQTLEASPEPPEAIGLPAAPAVPAWPDESPAEVSAPAPELEPEPAPSFDEPEPTHEATPSTDTAAGAFDGLVGPEPAAETKPAGPGVPSAEVPVPVDMVQQIAQRVISQVSERIIREIAWDVIPGLAEKLIRAEIERIKARAESERD